MEEIQEQELEEKMSSSFLQETIKKREYHIGKSIIKICSIIILGVCIGLILSFILNMVLSLRTQVSQEPAKIAVQGTIYVDTQSSTQGSTLDKVGVVVSQIDAKLQEEYNIPIGLFVKDLDMESEIYKSGIKLGDVITKFNDKSIYQVDDFLEAARETSKQTYILSVLRKGIEEYEEYKIEVNFDF